MRRSSEPKTSVTTCRSSRTIVHPPLGVRLELPLQKNSTETNFHSNTTTNNQTIYSNANVNETVEQRTEIRQAIKEVHVAAVKEVDVTMSIGPRIPKKVHFERLRLGIVKIVPAYEG
jgi:hypothetical protein